jgi:hypothetical protein
MSKKKSTTLSVTRGGTPIDRNEQGGGAAVPRSDSEVRTTDRADPVAGGLPISQGPEGTSAPKLVGYQQTGSSGIYEGAGTMPTPTGEEVRARAAAEPPFRKPPMTQDPGPSIDEYLAGPANNGGK